MKTINPDIEIFTNLESALKVYNKKQSAHLLQGKGIYSKDYFVDTKKDAILEWPDHYIMVKAK
jgi:hypothetical protein